MTELQDKEIGGNIDARCSKCKVIANHIIMTFENEKVCQVRCEQCDYVHGYRQPRKKKSVSVVKSAASKANARKEAKLDLIFDELLTDINPEDAIPYNMNVIFKLNDVVEHLLFGIGKVVELITPNKAVVQFREGKKVLICVLKTDFEE